VLANNSFFTFFWLEPKEPKVQGCLPSFCRGSIVACLRKMSRFTSPFCLLVQLFYHCYATVGLRFTMPKGRWAYLGTLALDFVVAWIWRSQRLSLRS
jgi:hypothetical protein